MRGLSAHRSGNQPPPSSPSTPSYTPGGGGGGGTDSLSLGTPGGKKKPSSPWIFLKYLAGIGRLDFLGFSPIDFQGVGKT